MGRLVQRRDLKLDSEKNLNTLIRTHNGCKNNLKIHSHSPNEGHLDDEVNLVQKMHRKVIICVTMAT